MKRQIALNILSNYASRVVGIGLGFFLVPFLYTVAFGVPYPLRLAGFSVKEYWTETYFKPLLLGCPFYLWGVYRWVLNKHDRRYVHEGLMFIRSRLSRHAAE